MTKKAATTKFIVFGIVALAIVAIYVAFRDRLSLDALAEQEDVLRAYQVEHPFLVLAIAFAVYVGITGLGKTAWIFSELISRPAGIYAVEESVE